MKDVCDRHGALFILDEVMSGMGRTGTLHAWSQESESVPSGSVVELIPDLQTVAKGLGAGYAPIGALLVNKRVVDVLSHGTGAFTHSQTYQGHPVACAAANAVQQIIREEKLLENVRVMGAILGELLRERLGGHKNVGDIRGRGLLWGVSLPAILAPFGSPLFLFPSVWLFSRLSSSLSLSLTSTLTYHLSCHRD
jgi:adenosylmethionine-8-amino-7-oxononanoate aminotransferase